MNRDFIFWACRVLVAVGASTTSTRIRLLALLPRGDSAIDKLDTQRQNDVKIDV